MRAPLPPAHRRSTGASPTELRGRWAVKRVPSRSLELTSSRPPCDWTIFRAMKRPNPSPLER